MERWFHKVAIVTGATTPIGLSITHALLERELTVVELARRTERVEELAKKIDKAGKLFAVRCDVSREDDILRTFRWITERIGAVHILINAAGLQRQTTLSEGNIEDWRRVFEVNVMGLCICTREAIKSMKAKDVAGHIIHINALCGHYVPVAAEPIMNVYPASKFAVTALTETLRQELRHHQCKIKVTSISPGMISSEFQNSADDVTEESSLPSLKPEDVAEAVIYVLSTQPHVQVQELTIRPLGDPS